MDEEWQGAALDAAVCLQGANGALPPDPVPALVLLESLRSHFLDCQAPPGIGGMVVAAYPVAVESTI